MVLRALGAGCMVIFMLSICGTVAQGPKDAQEKGTLGYGVTILIIGLVALAMGRGEAKQTGDTTTLRETHYKEENGQKVVDYSIVWPLFGILIIVGVAFLVFVYIVQTDPDTFWNAVNEAVKEWQE